MVGSNRSEHLRYRYGLCLNDTCSKCKSKEVQAIAARKEFVCAECGKNLRECPPPKTWWDKYGKMVIAGGVLVVGGGVAALIPQFTGKDAGKEPQKPAEIEVGRENMKDMKVIQQLSFSEPALQLAVGQDSKLEVSFVPQDAQEGLVWSSSDESVVSVNSSGIVKAHKEGNAVVTVRGEQSAMVSAEVQITVGKNKIETGGGGAVGQGTLDLGYASYTGSLKNGKANGLGTLTFKQSRRISQRDSKARVAEPGDYVVGTFENNEVVTVKWYGADKKLKGTILAGSNALN